MDIVLVQVHCTHTGTLYSYRYIVLIYRYIVLIQVHCTHTGTLYSYTGTLYSYTGTLYSQVHCTHIQVHCTHTGTLCSYRYIVLIQVHCAHTSFMVDPLSYFSFQPVLHKWCNKGYGMCYPVCGMVHTKEPLLLIGKSSPCGISGFPLTI